MVLTVLLLRKISQDIFSLILHEVDVDDFDGWVGSIYAAGDTVTDMNMTYIIDVQYILSGDDVEVFNGEMISCSYDFTSKFITIPDTLDGQIVTGLGDSVQVTKRDNNKEEEFAAIQRHIT